MPSRDAGLLGERDELADCVGDHPARQPQVPAPRHQPAGHEDQRVRAERRSLGHGGAVVRRCGFATVGVGIGEEPAPAQTGYVQARGPHRGSRRRQAQLGDLVAPQADGGNVMPDAQVDCLGGT